MLGKGRPQQAVDEFSLFVSVSGDSTAKCDVLREISRIARSHDRDPRDVAPDSVPLEDELRRDQIEGDDVVVEDAVAEEAERRIPVVDVGRDDEGLELPQRQLADVDVGRADLAERRHAGERRSVLDERLALGAARVLDDGEAEAGGVQDRDE